MIKTRKATEKYLENQKRPILNKIIKQHNIIGVSRMNINDLRDLMYKKRVHEYDTDFKEPRYLLRPRQIQETTADLKKKVHHESERKVHYVKEVVKKNKIIKLRDDELKDYKGMLDVTTKETEDADNYIKELEMHNADIEKSVSHGITSIKLRDDYIHSLEKRNNVLSKIHEDNKT